MRHRHGLREHPDRPGHAPASQRDAGAARTRSRPARRCAPATGDPVPTLGAADRHAARPGDVQRRRSSGMAQPGHPAHRNGGRSSGSTGSSAPTTCAGDYTTCAAPGLDALREARRHARADGREHDRRAPPVPPARVLDAADRPDEGGEPDLHLAVPRVPGQHRRPAGLHADTSGSSSTTGRSPTATTLGGGLGRWVFHCHIFFHATIGMLGRARGRPPPRATSVPTSMSATRT